VDARSRAELETAIGALLDPDAAELRTIVENANRALLSRLHELASRHTIDSITPADELTATATVIAAVLLGGELDRDSRRAAPP
jgi:hypothetical protein